MSTKLYNGYKINNLSVIELKTFTDELKERLKKIFDAEYNHYYAILATGLIDDIITLDYMCDKLGNIDELESYLISTYKNSYNKCWIIKDFIKGEINTNIKEALETTFSTDYFGWVGNIAHNTIECKNFISNVKGTHSVFDFQNEIVFFPSQNKILFLAYGRLFTSLLDKILSSRKKVDIDFRKKYGFEYYGYWNNTDKPENVSYKKWNERGDEWDEVLKSDYIPSKHGICCELISEETLFNDKSLYFKIEINIPSPVERANKIALEIIRKNWMNAEERKEMSAMELIEKFNELYEEHFFDFEINSIREDLEKLLPIMNEKLLKTKLIDFAPNYKKRKGI